MQEKRQSVLLNSSAFDHNFLLSYDLFPKGIIRSTKEWEQQKRNMQEGDIIVQWVRVPPFSHLAVYFLFGVQIVEVINTSQIRSFTYHTLSGHPEKGRASFILEKMPFACRFTIHSYSSPAGILNTVPIAHLVHAYQDFSVEKILAGLKNRFPVPT